MQVLHAKSALMPEGWARDVTITIDKSGRIASLSPAPADISVDILLPAPGNVHSHAFQRAMAGLSEQRGETGQDSFWTWRQLMYRFLDNLTPEDVEAIAALVQMEMLEAGFAAIGEFHYLHHQPGGTPYGDISEMSQRICAAAAQSGIGMTLLPVLYQQGGVDGRPLGPGQVRFGNDPDAFARLMNGAAAALADLPADSVLGAAPHSLRAVTPGALADLPAQIEGPLHLHLAEQVAEVEEIEAAYGARPVNWLLDNQPPDDRWCLIHCTQMLPQETVALAGTGAVAGLCPITEANLGDGPFNGPAYLQAHGAFGIGSDSNVRISLTEELRTLEYSQRLRDMARNVMVVEEGSVGHMLYTGAARGGAQALGRKAGTIAVGQLADLVAIDSHDTALMALPRHQLLDGLVFAATDAAVTDVWSAGRHMVQGGRHVAREGIVARYRAAMDSVTAAL